jgi:ElaB/YqjD/DUF883 family membrane-anchored ribosome-binding protein
MKKEQILSEFTKLANEEAAKAKSKFEARIKELKSEKKHERVAPKWNLKPSFKTVITDVTPKGYGN